MTHAERRAVERTDPSYQEFVFRTVSVEGQTIRVCVRPGEPSVTPLLIFNGLGASLELLFPFVKALDPSQEVITFDIPGIGESSVPLLPYTFKAMAKTVTQLLDVLGYGQVHVAGLSWGGFLAQQFAYDHPSRCSKLILAATSAGMFSIHPSPKVLRLMSSPRRYSDPAFGASIAPDIYGGSFRDNPEQCFNHFAKMKPSVPGRGYKYQLLAVAGWHSLYWLHQIRQPTLVLAGNDDPIIPLTNMRVLASYLPNSQLHVIEDGHLFLITQPTVIAPTVSAFLAAA